MADKAIKFGSEVDRDGFVSVVQVAAKTSLSLATIYKEIRSGVLPSYDFLNKTCLKPVDVERWAQIRVSKRNSSTPRSNRGRKTKKGAVKNARTQNRAKIPA